MRPLVCADLGAVRCSGMEHTLKVIIEVQLTQPSASTLSLALTYADIYIGQ